MSTRCAKMRDEVKERFKMSKNELVKPILKWVGGKRQLLPEIEKYIPKGYSTYYEPFLGGAAVLLNEQPRKAVVNDYNEELINTYKVVRDNVNELIEELKVHDEKNSKEYFYEIREWDRLPGYEERSDVEIAGRFLFLNKTCFNGLYRVNSAGEFNTPYGRYKNPNIINEIGLRALHNYFNEADITFKTGDFEDAVKYIRKGSFVYADPPYQPISTTSNYTGYTSGGFGEDDQVRLKKMCDGLDKRGVKFLLSNSNVPFITDLYKDYKIEIVGANRAINSNGKKRGKVEEVLIRNYEI